jgi:ABC-type protease/lipase transport system fused ATPase/permease subunit
MTQLSRTGELEILKIFLKDAIEREFQTLRAMALRMDVAEQWKAQEHSLLLETSTFRS